MISFEEIQTYIERIDLECPEAAKLAKEKEGEKLLRADEIYNKIGMLIATIMCIMIIIGVLSIFTPIGNIKIR